MFAAPPPPPATRSSQPLVLLPRLPPRSLARRSGVSMIPSAQTGLARVPRLRIPSEALQGAHSGSYMGVSCTRQELSQQRRSISHSSRVASAAIFCAAALNSRCAAEQTQTVQRPSSTITIAPNQGKEMSQDKSPKLDDGGSGFPPFNFGGGGGGGGGGGYSSSGGFYLFAFLVFLGYLKDLEEEKDAREKREKVLANS